MLFLFQGQLSTYQSLYVYQIHLLELFKYARVQVLVHIPMADGICSSFLRRIDRRIEVHQLIRELDAHFEWIRHCVH